MLLNRIHLPIRFAGLLIINFGIKTVYEAAIWPVLLNAMFGPKVLLNISWAVNYVPSPCVPVRNTTSWCYRYAKAKCFYMLVDISCEAKKTKWIYRKCRGVQVEPIYQWWVFVCARCMRPIYAAVRSQTRRWSESIINSLRFEHLPFE